MLSLIVIMNIILFLFGISYSNEHSSALIMERKFYGN